jgi:hypothetical protein
MHNNIIINLVYETASVINIDLLSVVTIFYVTQLQFIQLSYITSGAYFFYYIF